MPPDLKNKSAEKENLHPRNLHRQGYDFKQLTKTNPALGAYVKPNAYGNISINFNDPKAVIELNKALLKHFYNINNWATPEGYLCPPIPGRADYIHYVADLLSESNDGVIPTGNKIKALDIGVGANCVYPLIGNSVYGWEFTGADIDEAAIQSARQTIGLNVGIKQGISCRHQRNKADIFKGIIKPEERFDITVCNPPFHSSWQEAQAGTTRKLRNLNSAKPQKTVLNFGGKNNELWYEGGEATFIKRMIEQSALFAKNVYWFTTLVSKKENLAAIYKALNMQNVTDVKTIHMAQGQKISRVVAWTFLNETERAEWKNTR